MLQDIGKYMQKIIDIFKKRIYGKTLVCPVCHLELSYHDLDENNCAICPLCGVVIETADVYGHSVPVINDVHIFRHQPKLRLHPLSTHLPIGLFPFAFLGAVFLLLVSLYLKFIGPINDHSFLLPYLPHLSKVILVLLVISSVSSILTFISGVIDWYRRYEKRSYRFISLKIILSWMFLFCAVVIIILHGFVFQAGTVAFSSVLQTLAAIVYFMFMILETIIIAILGHVGGNLVFGK